MRFKCGPTSTEWFEIRENWHVWFAWRPVQVASHDCRWLEKVERKGEFFSSFGHDFWRWEYRAL